MHRLNIIQNIQCAITILLIVSFVRKNLKLNVFLFKKKKHVLIRFSRTRIFKYTESFNEFKYLSWFESHYKRESMLYDARQVFKKRNYEVVTAID